MDDQTVLSDHRPQVEGLLRENTPLLLIPQTIDLSCRNIVTGLGTYLSSVLSPLHAYGFLGKSLATQSTLYEGYLSRGDDIKRGSFKWYERIKSDEND